MRLSDFNYLRILTLAFVSLPHSLSAQTACCQAPTSESTAAKGASTTANYMTAEMFVMTLSGGSSWTGGTLQEFEGQTGTDTCYANSNNTSPYGAFTSVTGSTWTIGSAAGGVTITSSQWGADEVGYLQNPVAWYRANLPKLGKPLPCGFHLYQELQFKCPSGSSTEIIFSGINLTATINTASVSDCRDGVCATINK